MGEVEKPKDRDFIETVEGFLFCVVGYLHPPDGYTAYMKYMPDPAGKWSKGETHYTRVIPYYHISQVEAVYDLLKERHPQYIFNCPVRKITISSVPCDSVRTYYRPRPRLRSLIAKGASDPLEQRLIDLVLLLSEISGIEEGDIGVTGSLLTETHNPKFSDIDLTVYGVAASHRIKRALFRAKGEGNDLQPFSREKMENWIRTRSERFSISPRDLYTIAKRRWNFGLYRGTYFSIHPVRTDNEITERYGSRLYQQLGVVAGTARIADTSDSIYLPAIYGVEDIETEEPEPYELEQIVSYESLFSDIFEEGERVSFMGVLEEVTGERVSHRVVIGSAGSKAGYIKLAD
jgi:predicted nucleotidyltransferase